MVQSVSHGVVYIVDLANVCGTTSVTNDAENVVSNIAREYGNMRIFYRDTDGQWDELVHDNGKFIRFAPGTTSA
jgi:hypothetical protein